jgi:hypothetical protein
MLPFVGCTEGAINTALIIARSGIPGCLLHQWAFKNLR